MLKLLHAADLHLDSPFSGLPPEAAVRRRAEQREILRRMTQLARERGADLVLLSGDVFDAGRVRRDTQDALREALGEMPCPVFIAPGNHDPYTHTSPYAALDWPQGVHIFTGADVQGVQLPALGCTVWGAAFTAPRREDSPLRGFTAPQDGGIHVMALHADVDGNADYAPVTRDEIAHSGLSYLALGHVHRHSGLNRAGETFWAYPGCPEGRGFDETGEKGVIWAQVSAAGVEAEFVPLCARRYKIVEVPLTGVQDVQRAVLDALGRDMRADICRVVLTGEYPTGILRADALERALAEHFFQLTVRDQTRPPHALWARMEEDSLTGLFLREMANALEKEPESETLTLAVRFGLAALEDGEDVAP